MARGAQPSKLFLALDEGIVVAAILAPGHMDAKLGDPDGYRWTRTLCGKVQRATPPTRTRALVLYRTGCAYSSPGQMVPMDTGRRGLALGIGWRRDGESDGVSLLDGSTCKWLSHLAGSPPYRAIVGRVAAYGVATIRKQVPTDGAKDGREGGARVGGFVVVGVSTFGEWQTWSLDSAGQSAPSKGLQHEKQQESKQVESPVYLSVSGQV